MPELQGSFSDGIKKNYYSNSMQWSKLKSKVKELLCPELKDRVDFYLTSYRKSHDEADKVWITVDRQKVFSCKHYPYDLAERGAYYEGLSQEEVKELLLSNEIHNPKDFGEAMRNYLSLPIREALQSSNPLIRAFAIIDRRIGKRTIKAMKVSDSEHTLIKKFYNLRCSAS